VLERGHGIFNWKRLLQRVQAMFDVALLDITSSLFVLFLHINGGSADFVLLPKPL
jgi:hypothetical protein